MPETIAADLEADLNNLVMSEQVEPLYAAVRKFIAEDIEPNTPAYFEAAFEHGDRWSLSPRQEDILGGLKDKAKANGLWNFFLPDAETERASTTSTTPTSLPNSARIPSPPNA